MPDKSIVSSVATKVVSATISLDEEAVLCRNLYRRIVSPNKPKMYHAWMVSYSSTGNIKPNKFTS